ncbi:MAG: flagellar biosynthetic protein FliQ [Deltaproteobacteria bacterium CG_4_10_14_3_um_filter_60_8]|nr:MAG: EscS/YscS/HrcS family type III secretion system export apparatus protein [Desulfobacterales bacterium CG2_30_60_27]PIP42998.1 MAG: flagellar biosynthetic protein FliQ [Deltaproteobacteria bacterium CG23_combo_of_CG06-09_8_20_14_all_60_8]PIY23097.1 MAG: flagellar biosynthetic protein FliQ [Deltaproteobacteria bacterium CG_4_10_14_3_um_filter_60_8]
MGTFDVLTLANNAIMITMLLSAPLLLVGMVVGMVIALFQAVTQIQEMTLTFVPKIFAIMFTLMFFSSWMIMKLSDYTRDLILQIPDLVR